MIVIGKSNLSSLFEGIIRETAKVNKELSLGWERNKGIDGFISSSRLKDVDKITFLYRVSIDQSRTSSMD